MLSVRWRKPARDLWMAKGRTVLMIAAIAISIFAVGTILSMYSILTREISVNYMNTNPASATLVVDPLDEEALQLALTNPAITQAEQRAVLRARVKVSSDEWRPFLLFVVPNFQTMKINTPFPKEGEWPSPDRTIVLEQTTGPFLDTQSGDKVNLLLSGGEETRIAVSGFVHDPSLAPSSQERTGYGYVTASTLQSLGIPVTFDQLRIVVNDRLNNSKAIEQIASQIAKQLSEQGRTVSQIEIPPPGKHPHQNQLTAMLVIFLIFSVLSLVLSAILVSVVMTGMLAQQVRQIGVLKAIGANTMQIVLLYLVMVIFICAAAVAVAVPLSMVAGRAVSGLVADMLNFTLFSTAVDWWVYAIQIVSGILLPLLAALLPIRRSSKITVLEAVNDHGVSTPMRQKPSKSHQIVSMLLSRIDRSFIMAIRNMFRRRGRLMMNLILLATGGAMFITGLNVASAWEKDLDKSYGYRGYDLEVVFHEWEPSDKMIELLKNVPNVLQVESWGRIEASVARPGGFDVVNTYPDGGHGSFTLRSPPEGSKLIHFPMMEGSWLQRGDVQSVVLNHMAAAMMPEAKVGQTIALSVHGEQRSFRIIGIMKEIGSPAAAYITQDAFQSFVGKPGLTRSMRLVTQPDSDGKHDATYNLIDQTLMKEGAYTEVLISDKELRTSVSEHVSLLITALIALSLLLAAVGILGLAYSISTNVIERTREIGIMQTVGGTPATIIRNVTSEGVLIGLISWFIAVPLSLPLSAWIGSTIGGLALRSPLPLTLSLQALSIWLAVIVIASAVASTVPAWRASRITIRQALDSI